MMTKYELKKNVEILRAKKKEVEQSKKAAREFLVSAGIYTTKGKLRKEYQ